MLCNNVSIKELIKEIKPEIAIIAPDCKEGMLLHAKELKEVGIPFIFDPGQAMPQFNKEELLELISGSKAALFNDYEIQLFTEKADLSVDKVRELTEYLIVTKGRKGSDIFYKGKEYKIPSAEPDNESDPTGAGDAYRAGIIYGLIHDLPIETMGKIASLCAIYTVEKYGTQTHKYTFDEFKERYKVNYNEDLKL
jgi:adenosine kinase